MLRTFKMALVFYRKVQLHNYMLRSYHVAAMTLDTSITVRVFSLTVKVATLIFISGRGSAISSAKRGKSGFIYNLVKSSVTFATVVVRFICLRFSLRFFRHRRRL